MGLGFYALRGILGLKSFFTLRIFVFMECHLRMNGVSREWPSHCSLLQKRESVVSPCDCFSPPPSETGRRQRQIRLRPRYGRQESLSGFSHPVISCSSLTIFFPVRSAVLPAGIFQAFPGSGPDLRRPFLQMTGKAPW